jgi:ubiquinone/menaquinone biosynthesis C-methylase UbiE
MGFYEEQILPRLTDRVLRSEEAARLRARVTAGLSGEVLEVGFGSGLNMPYYPSAVTRVRAVDPSAVARKLAAERVAASAVPVEYIGADAQTLPLADASVDHVVSVLTLCTIPAVDRALAEIRRVLRPGGAFHFMEHRRNRWPGGSTGSPRFSAASSAGVTSTGPSAGWWRMPGWN